MASSQTLSIILDLKDKATQGLGDFGTKVQSLKPQLQKMAGIGVAGFVGLSAVILKTTQDAATAEGTWNKFNTVFADGKDDMKDYINQIRKEMPLATDEIARMAADLQDLLVPMGLTRDSAQDLTKQSLDLANKIAAFNDVDPSEVLEAMRAGFVGSSEALRNFGIDARTEALEQVAKEIGLVVDGFDELDPKTRSQVKAMALMEQMTRQSSDAIEGFEENQDSLIRRQQELKATMSDLSGILGNTFIPLIDSVVKALLPIITNISNWIQANPILARNIILVSAALFGLLGTIGLLGLAIPSILQGFGFLGTAISKVGTALTWLTSTTGIIVITIGLLIAAVYLLITHWEDLKLKTIEIWNSIKDFFAEWWEGLSTATQGWLLLIANILTGGLLGWIILLRENWDTISQNITVAWTGIKDFFQTIWDSITAIFTEAIDGLLDKIRPLLDAINTVIDGAKSIGGKVGSAVKSGFSKAGNFLRDTFSVNDAIISPDGKIITTHPDDYLIATKNPQSLVSGGGVTHIHLNLDGREVSSIVLDNVMGDLSTNVKLNQ